ncbi:MAG TPA: hypothetical protein VMH23_11500 [Bacteroidota bacterium]|nr:hypothetical protein [Bacteroidota bacterium]
MRRSGFIILILVVLWFVGCQEKLPVELAADQSASALEVKVLPAIDSTLIVDASVDTSGVLQTEEQAYPATLLVSGVKTDFGTYRATFSYSRILLNDPKHPITRTDQQDSQSSVSAKVIGYLGLDVGNAKVNSVDIPKSFRPFRTWSSVEPNQFAGRTYTLVDEDNAPASNFVYAAGQQYRFVADGKNSIPAFSKEISSPDEITLVEPKAGQILFRSDDLHLQWQGKRGQQLRLLISSFDEQSNVPVKPLLQVSIQEGSSSVTIPAKVMQSVQANGSGHYMLSFISSNSISTTISPDYDGSVLVQAASIHNVLLWLK